MVAPRSSVHCPLIIVDVSVTIIACTTRVVIIHCTEIFDVSTCPECVLPRYRDPVLEKNSMQSGLVLPAV